jgi:serine protease
MISWQSRTKAALCLLPVLIAAVVLLSGGRAAAGHSRFQSPAGRPTNPPTDQIIIQFGASERALSPAETARRQDRLNAAAGRPLTFVRPMSGGAYVYRLPSPLAEREFAAIAANLAALPEVSHAEPDIVLRHTGRVPAQPPAQSGVSPREASASPNDPSFADQWHYRYTSGVMEGVNLEPAWNITTGSPDIVVAVLDTGIVLHADLVGRTVPGYDFITSLSQANDNDHPAKDNSRDADPSDPGDWQAADDCGPGSSAYPSSWHGTHVAGTIGAASNNGGDVAGVNWQAKLLPARVLGRCGGELSDVIDAIRWSAGLAVPGAPPNTNPARVINMSLGGGGTCSPLMQSAINDAAAAGALSVVAAGNSLDIADFYTPASCNNVITVAATTRAGDLAWYSNFGSVVEVSAPGGETNSKPADGVLSTFNTGSQGPGNDTLGFYQGTSMAAPHVAGVASLLLGLDPGLTPAEVSDIIQTTARDFPPGSDCVPWACGEGIVDAFAALKAVDDPGEATATPTPTATATDGPSPTATATTTPTATPTDEPSPTATPTTTPTSTPTGEPSPTAVPDGSLLYLPAVFNRDTLAAAPPD